MSEKAMSELKYGDWWELETLKRISTKAVDIVEGEIVDVYSDKKKCTAHVEGGYHKKLQNIAVSVHTFCDGTKNKGKL